MQELPNYENAAEANNLYATAYKTLFYMTRIIQNLNNLSNYPNVKKATFINPNLYEIAAQFYNDATKWNVIAQANNVNTPFLTGQYLLAIPDNTTPSNGGILNG